MLNLDSIIESEVSIDKFKRFVCFKHIFLLGLSQELLESETMKHFLQAMVAAKMSPVNLFLVKNCVTKDDLKTQGYLHLCINKLPLFPNVVVKHSDISKKSKA